MTRIGNEAFKLTGLTAITIPEGMTTIGDQAFRSCTALTSVTIPESMTSIGVGAFKGCTELASVTMNFNDTKVKTIDTAAFDSIKNGAAFSAVAKDASPKTFKTWSSTAKSGGTAATFTDATTASTTLTNVPNNCTITAEYEVPADEAQWTVGSEMKSGTFADALTAMGASGGSIKLLTAVSTSSMTTLPAQAIALDFNGQTWTSGSGIQVQNGCTLTVTGTGGGGITAAATTGVTVQPDGTLDLRSGSITCTASGFSGISNSGTLKLSGGTVTSTLASAIANMANGMIYLSGAPTITSASPRMGINCAAGTTVIANDGNVSSPSYSTGAVSIQVPSKSIAGYVAVSGLKDADHAKKFTLGNVPEGLVFFYDDSTNSIKLATAPENAAVPTIAKDLSTTQVVYSVGGKAAALDATATVTDGGTITYDWYSNATNSTTGGTKLNATTATYTPPTTTAGTTYYYCVVTNTNSAATVTKKMTATSAVANIKVEAASESYGIYVGDTLIDANNKGDVFGNGTATYSSDTNTLTLNGVTINDDNKYVDDYNDNYLGIFSEQVKALNLVLKGENKIDIGVEYPCFGIITNGSLTISGDGTLNISVNSTNSNIGIQSNGLTVNSGTLKITTGKASASYGINSYSDFTLANGSVTITTADENGEAMGIIGKNLAVNGGNLKITTGKAETSCGMYAQASIKVTNGVVDITAGETLDKTNGISLGMYCEDRTNTAILITGGTVTVATKGSVGDIVQAILPAPNFSGYTGCTPVGSTSSDGTGAVSYVANNNVSYKYVKIYKANPADKGWTIDNAGNLTISTAAGMTDWVKNGRDTHKATLKTATIDEAVTKINNAAFFYCLELTSVKAPGATEIEGNAFYDCSKLATVDFPKVKTIGGLAFFSCNELENEAFPAATEIYGRAFWGCAGLATLQLPATPPDVVAGAFEDCPPHPSTSACGRKRKAPGRHRFGQYPGEIQGCG